MNDLILEVWNLFEEHVPVRKREDVAIGFLKVVEEYGIELGDLDFTGESKYLQEALDVLVEVDPDEADDEETGFDYDED